MFNHTDQLLQPRLVPFFCSLAEADARIKLLAYATAAGAAGPSCSAVSRKPAVWFQLLKLPCTCRYQP